MLNHLLVRCQCRSLMYILKLSDLKIRTLYNYYDLSNFYVFVFSVCSSSSSISTKFDPDLLKSDVAHAKNRVSRLKRELEQIKTEVSYTQKGVETLAM